MGLIEGVYLETLLSQAAFPPRAALETLSAVCRALETAPVDPASTINPATTCIDSTGRIRLNNQSGDAARDVLELGEAR